MECLQHALYPFIHSSSVCASACSRLWWIRSCSLSHWTGINSPNLHMEYQSITGHHSHILALPVCLATFLGQWEETEESGGIPWEHGENMQNSDIVARVPDWTRDYGALRQQSYLLHHHATHTYEYIPNNTRIAEICFLYFITVYISLEL